MNCFSAVFISTITEGATSSLAHPGIRVEKSSKNASATSDDESSDDDDEEGAELGKETESERLRRLAASGLLTRNKRKPPAPPTVAETADLEGSKVFPTADQNITYVDDAYARWVALQKNLPPLPSTSTRESLGLPPSTPSIDAAAATITPTLAKSSASSAGGGFFTRLSAGLSRSTPSPNHDVASSTPVIRTLHASPSDSIGTASEVGKTWSSLIDPSALKEMPERERKRQEAVFELIATENAYVQNLQLLVSQFFVKLEPLMHQQRSDVIFANIEDILLFNTTLLSDLEQRQQDSRLYVERIDDVLHKHIRGLDVYRPYCINQEAARRTLENAKVDNLAVADALQSLRVNDLELEHFLLQPMQRLTRYVRPDFFSKVKFH